MERPMDVKSLQGFLGSVNWFRRHIASHAEIQFPLNQLTDDRVKISEHIKVIQDMPHRSRCDRADQSARCILDLDPPAWRESNNHDCALRRSLGGGLKTHLDLGQRAEDPPGFWAAGRLPTWISGDGLQTHLYRGSGAAGVPVSRAYH